MRRAFSSLVNPVKYDYPLRHEVVVPWGDMDAFQHVNHVNFLHYAEAARAHYMTFAGWFDPDNRLPNLPILKSLSCNFIREVCLVFNSSVNFFF
jgi:acyl-CoA thioester hydrolase